MSENGKNTGFASMDPEAARDIQRMGGKAAQASGKAHRFTPEQARAAAQKSVEVRRAKKQALLAAQGNYG